MRRIPKNHKRRKELAEYLIEKGYSLNYVQFLLGYSPTTILEVYQFKDVDRKAKVYELLKMMDREKEEEGK